MRTAPPPTGEPPAPASASEPYALCEAVLFHGRDEDDWYLLEWWGETIGWVVYELPDRSIYADDSGPVADPPAETKRHVCTYQCADTDCENVVGPPAGAPAETERPGPPDLTPRELRLVSKLSYLGGYLESLARTFDLKGLPQLAASVRREATEAAALAKSEALAPEGAAAERPEPSERERRLQRELELLKSTLDECDLDDFYERKRLSERERSLGAALRGVMSYARQLELLVYEEERNAESGSEHPTMEAARRALEPRGEG